jgi:hypothetical protein
LQKREQVNAGSASPQACQHLLRIVWELVFVTFQTRNPNQPSAYSDIFAANRHWRLPIHGRQRDAVLPRSVTWPKMKAASSRVGVIRTYVESFGALIS